MVYAFAKVLSIERALQFAGFQFSVITDWMKLFILRTHSCFMFGVACAYVLRVKEAVA